MLPLLTASFGSALLLAIAMPGRIGWWPLLFVALVPLLLFVAAHRPGRSFVAGWLSGFVYHAALLYWIVIVLGKYGGLPFWLAVIVMLLLSLYMGLYLGFFAGLISMVAGKGHEENVAAIVILSPLLWIGFDWLRGIAFTGFPWMDLGYGIYSQPLLIQAADLGGHHLVTFEIVLVNTLLFCLLYKRRSGLLRKNASLRHVVTAACMFLVVLSVYSVDRYRQVEDRITNGDKQVVAVVQGNIPQDEKWTPTGKQETLDIYKNLTEQSLDEKKADLVVWPETALAFYPVNDPLFFSVTGLAREKKFHLLTGAPYFTLDLNNNGGRPDLKYFNSALLIDSEGELTGRYNKQHLVPFGEYVPLSRFLPFLEPVVEHIGNFSPGNSNDPLQFGKVKAGVLICFESIFADLARKQVSAGANLLVNLTNDAWYGRSSAPYQSFAMSVFRSVETRRSLVRAANTGISGFVDPLGRIVGASPVFEPMAFSEEVYLVGIKSVFIQFGFLFGPGCLIFASFLLFVFVRRRMRD